MNTITHYTTINGKKIHYQILNSDFRKENNPVLVFLHEGLGSVKQWRDFPALLSKQTGCTALIYDRYGYGESEMCDNVRPRSFLEDEAFIYLPELLEKAVITERVILIGHSDGGSIALLFASRYHSKTLAVITEADHVICEPITLKGVKNIVKEYKKGGLKKLLTKFHADKSDSLFYSWSAFWLNKELKNWNIIDALSKIYCPVLSIQGKNDCYGSEKQLNVKLNTIHGQVEILYIPECGHVPHFELQNLILAKMRSFISNLP